MNVIFLEHCIHFNDVIIYEGSTSDEILAISRRGKVAVRPSFGQITLFGNPGNLCKNGHVNIFKKCRISLDQMWEF